MAYDRKANNTTNYEHPNELNLWELHRAMDYDANGQPVIRTLANNSAKNAGTSAFGEPYAIQITPVVQLDAIYGINPLEFETFANNGGSYAAEESTIRVSSSDTTYSTAVVRSKHFLKYRPGQGALGRFAARFQEGIAGTQQRAGFLSFEEGFQIGYNGTEFGILHQYNRRLHIEELIINTAASSSQTVTVVLNGEVYNIPIVAGTLSETAARIAVAINQPQWQIEQYGSNIHFVYLNLGEALTGEFSISSTGNVTGTMFTQQESAIGIENWIPQSEWNGDPCNGTGNSRIVLDPTKFNVFQINFRWLGAGEIRFSMENPETGDFMTLHHIHWTNRNTQLHSRDPSFAMGFQVFSLVPNATVTMYGGSILGAIEGVRENTKLSHSATATKSGLGSNTLHHLGTLRNPIVHAGKMNLSEIVLDTMSVAFQGNDPLEVLGFYDATLATGTQAYEDYPSVRAQASLVTGTVLENKVPTTAFILPINGSGILDLSQYNIRISPNSTFTIAVRSSQSVSQIAASITWHEL